MSNDVLIVDVSKNTDESAISASIFFLCSAKRSTSGDALLESLLNSPSSIGSGGLVASS